MGFELRRVPADWQHPKNEQGHYIPLHDGAHLADEAREWDEGAAKWADGLVDNFEGGWSPRETGDGATYGEWAGPRPDPNEYTPAWPEEQCTHFMLYEDVSEGTPKSPAFKTHEELAHWLVDNKVSAGGGPASYEAWLATCRQGWAVTGAKFGDEFITGVELNLRRRV